MRHRASCWTKTLAKLGFRRLPSRRSHKGLERRRFGRFEPLEARQMLSITVNTFLDDNDDISDNVISLREAIAEAANYGNQIEFDPSLHGSTILLEHGQLTLSSSIDIIGPGADLLTIDAQGESRLFRVTSAGAAVTISGLTLRSGSENGGGGAVYNVGNLTLDSVIVTGNTTDTSGGGVYSHDGSKLTIKNSIFESNQATGAAGSGVGGGVSIRATVADALKIENSAFIDNTAKSGGAVDLNHRAAGSAVAAKIVNATLADNRADYGGGLRITTNGGGTAPVDIVNVTIAGNEALASTGGGAYVYNPSNQAALNFHNTVVADNLAPVAYQTNRDFIGAMSSASSNNLVEHGYAGLGISNNDARNNKVGVDPALGALGLHGGSTPVFALNAGSPALDAGNVAHATAFDQRGYNRRVDRSGTSSALIDIGSYELGLVVNANNDPATWSYSDSELTLREALAIAALVTGLNEIEFAENVVAAGEILVASELTVDSSVDIMGPGADKLTLDGQDATRVIRVTSAVTDASIRGLTITGGRHTNGGGGIYSQGNLALDGMNFVSNSASSGGAAVYHAIGHLTVTDSNFEDNHTINTPTSADRGGALRVLLGSSGRLLVQNSSFIDNSAYWGGAVEINTGPQGSGPVAIVDNSTFSGNLATNGGGALRVLSGIQPPGQVLVTNSTIVRNESLIGGGGVRTESGNFTPDLILHNTIVADNIVPAGYEANADFAGVISGQSTHNLIGVGYAGLGVTHNSAGNKVGAVGNAIPPLLGPLQDNGGLTKTHAPLVGSTAIDAGSDAHASDFDQRGFGRSYDAPANNGPGGSSDIGAVEFNVTALLDSDGVLTVDDTDTDINTITLGVGIAAGRAVVTLNGKATPHRIDEITAIEVFGGDGSDSIDLRGVNPYVLWNLESVTIDGGDGDDVIYGTMGGDRIIGGDGSNIMFGGLGNDAYAITDEYFSALGRTELISDQDGVDTLDFSGWVSNQYGVEIDLAKPLNQTQYLDHDDKLGLYFMSGQIENVLGTSQADLILGNDAPNILDGASAGDTINGLDGDDVLIGGDGNDTLDGGDGEDDIRSGSGIDDLAGGPGKDTFDADANDTAAPEFEEIGTIYVRKDQEKSVRMIVSDANSTGNDWTFELFNAPGEPKIPDTLTGIGSDGVLTWDGLNNDPPGTYKVGVRVVDGELRSDEIIVTIVEYDYNDAKPVLGAYYAWINDAEPNREVLTPTPWIHEHVPGTGKTGVHYDLITTPGLGTGLEDLDIPSSATVHIELNPYLEGHLRTYDTQTANDALTYKLIDGPGSVSGNQYAWTATAADAGKTYRLLFEVEDAGAPDDPNKRK
jgi:Ca2+-binding RTX toxin-like protein